MGFVFDYRVCNVPDFYQFLIYYCHQIINLQFINGTFVAFPKHMGYMGYQYPNNQNMYYQYGNNQNQFGGNHNTNFYMLNHQSVNKPGQSHHMYNYYEKNNQFNYGNSNTNYNMNNFAQSNFPMPNFPTSTFPTPNYANPYPFPSPQTLYKPPYSQP